MAAPTLPFGLHPVPSTGAPGERTGGRFGHLEVVRPLARGGTASVYLAADRQTGAQVALKVLDPAFATSPDLAARLAGEHHLAARAQHPGLLAVHGAGRTDDHVPYLVMEYLDGEPLAARAERGPLALEELLAIGAQIASALAALHAAGVIHCDVKPDNVLVLAGAHRGPRIKVIDYGVSRRVDEAIDPDLGIAGTPWCMAPEQWSGAPAPASDVYALGCLLFELATGAPPFDGTLPELMAAHLEQRPPRPSWLRPVPPALERLILRALAKDAAARPTMGEVADALFAMLDDAAPLARAS